MFCVERVVLVEAFARSSRLHAIKSGRMSSVCIVPCRVPLGARASGSSLRSSCFSIKKHDSHDRVSSSSPSSNDPDVHN